MHPAIQRDFSRNIWCILGINFDCSNMDGACHWIGASCNSSFKSVLSTPNLNWVVMSLQDKKFRQAVLNSDMSLIDGSPIFWTAKVLGLPFREKVPGSSLIEHLLSPQQKIPYRIFFFGGQKKAALSAYQAVNTKNLPVKAVGYCDPGYGTIEELSQEDMIANINDVDPDILLISLGAQKGVAWIEYNKNRIKAKVFSHVGAVVNFVSGRIKRSPVFFQKIGCEWVWRIFQEPFLLGRYFHDGMIFIRLLLTKVLPYKFFLIKKKHLYLSLTKKDQPLVETQEEASVIRILVAGVCLFSNDGPIRRVFADSAEKEKDVVVDLSGVVFTDNSFLGLLLLLKKYKYLQNKKMNVINPTRDMRKILDYNLLDDLLIC